MAFAGFAAAAVAGFLPRTALYSFFGDSLAQGDWGSAGIALGVIVVGGAGGIIAVQRWGRARAANTHQDELEEGAGSP